MSTVTKTVAKRSKSAKTKTKTLKKPKASLSSPSVVDKDWYSKSKSKVFIGAHVSISGGVYNAILETASIKGQAFGLFLCNQRTWNVKALTDEEASKFREVCDEHGFPSHLIVPHASYLLNCGSPEDAALEKSRRLFLDGVQRCEKLGIDLYNFHPGSTCGKIERKECIKRIAESINYVHSNTNNVITVIENMSKQGHTIGGDFKEIEGIISQVKDKSRVGVCFDTCHAFAAGYDLRSETALKKTLEEFDSIVGLKYLKAIHLNDSKGGLGCHLDRHENIGKGEIGKKIDTFRRIVNEPKFKNIPMILETPVVSGNSNDIYAKEIELLYNLIEE